MRALILVGLLLLVALTPASSQVVGTVQQHNWPLSTHANPPRDSHWRQFDVLPFIDHLTLGYRLRDGGALPDVQLALSWVPGREAVVSGQLGSYARLPEGIALVAFELRADVVLDGEVRGEFVVQVDSARLQARDTLFFAPQATWEELFSERSAEEARDLVRQGAQLERLRLVRAAFAVYDTVGSNRRLSTRPRGTVYRDESYTYSEWDLYWLFGSNSSYRTGSGYARGATGSSRSSDEDSDETGEYLGPALMVAAGVAALAYVGGSVGYYGTETEPLGLVAGFLGRRGGTLIQAGVNAQALGIGSGHEALSARILGLIPTGIPVEPVVGFGLRFYEVPGGDTVMDPIFPLGVAFRADPAVITLAGDANSGTVEFGLIFRFRK